MVITWTGAEGGGWGRRQEEGRQQSQGVDHAIASELTHNEDTIEDVGDRPPEDHHRLKAPDIRGAIITSLHVVRE